jgi:antitoxin ParD1/3/4
VRLQRTARVATIGMEPTVTIRAELGKHFETLVADLVASGRYESADEVLRDGLRLVEEREAVLARLDAAVMVGLADVEAGRLKPAEEVFDRLEAKYRTIG